MSSNSEILSPAIKSLLVSPSKAFFISARVFLTSGMSLWFLPRISISLRTLSIYFCMLSTLSIRAFSISIIDLSRSWYNSHVPAIWFWCFLCLLKLCFSPFSMPCNFFFDRHEQRTVVNRLLVIWWGEGQREVFQGPMIRPECFSELWTVNFTSVSVFFCPLGWKRMAWVASGWVFPFSHLQGYSWLELSISQVILRWVVVQSVSCVWVYATPWIAAHQTSLFFTISQSLLRLMSIEWVMPSNHLILCHPVCLLPSIFPSIRVFSSESALHIRSPNYWSFSISPSNEYSGFISFRIDWFDLLAVQGTLKSLFQHNSKATILW